jgi:uncharacterized protein (UPF0276 family)
MRSGSRPAVDTPTSVGRDLARLPALGIGLGYQAQLRDYIRSRRERFDFLEVVPDILWTDLGRGAEPRYRDIKQDVAFVRGVTETMPVIPHSIGLSIGSAHRYEYEHVQQMSRWFERLPFPWHSDHLAFHLTQGDPSEINLNLTMPVTFDWETLDLVAERVRDVQRRIPVPFLLENNVAYFEYGESAFDEASFLNALTKATGCGLLLDLHNLHTNARNLGVDPLAFLDRLELDRVVEIHVAGGLEFDGFYLDAHSGASPEPVWLLLEHALPRCANLCGVVFELFGSWFDELGPDGLDRQLGRMRALWAKYRAEPLAA